MTAVARSTVPDQTQAGHSIQFGIDRPTVSIMLKRNDIPMRRRGLTGERLGVEARTVQLRLRGD